MSKVKIINFYGLFFLGCLCAQNVNALSRPTGEIARSRGSMQQRIQSGQSRWSKFAAQRQEDSTKIFKQVQSIDPVQAIGLRKEVLHEAQMIGRCKEGEIFMSPESFPNMGFCVSRETMGLSDMISKSILYHGESKKKNQILTVKIPASLETIVDVIDFGKKVREHQVAAKDLSNVAINKAMKPELLNSFERLMSFTSVANYLDFPENIQDCLMLKIKAIINNLDQDVVSSESFNQFSDDDKKLLLLDPTTRYLKNKIIQKYASKRRMDFPNMRSIGDSSGKKIVSCPNLDLIVLSDISNLSAVKKWKITSCPGRQFANISPDGTKIVVSFGEGVFKLLDISNPDAIKERFLPGNTGNGFWWVQFNASSDGFLSTTTFRENTFLWDISDSNNIKTYDLTNELGEKVDEVVLSENGKMVVARYEYKTQLVVLDVSDPSNIKKKVLFGHPYAVSGFAISSDATKVVSWDGRSPSQANLWDLSDFDAIKPQPLHGYKGSIFSMNFSPDNTMVAAGGDGCVVWDTNDASLMCTIGELSDVLPLTFNQDSTTLVLNAFKNNDYKFVFYDIRDKQNPKFQFDIDGKHAATYNASLLFTDDDSRLILYGDHDYKNAFVQELLNDSEIALLDKMKKQCDVDQLKLIYQLCMASHTGKKIRLEEDSNELAIFNTLPEDIQNALTDWIGVNEQSSYCTIC